ncbi:MAG TPA: tail fiber protein [Bacteroidia bacterium]|nr:tail fiber protein [Bacteroidia bacterium]
MDEYLAMIKIFAGNFAPVGWAICDGSLLSISANTALYSILGTTYGGDGITTFGLPDLRARGPIGITGSGPAPQPPLNVVQGQKGGTVTVTLNANNLPPHNHPLLVNSTNSSQSAATAGASIATPGTQAGRDPFVGTLGFNAATPNITLNAASVGNNTGGSIPVNTMPPYLGIIYIICTQGLYPSRP